MKISIVTISFNQAQFLAETIRSVVEQNHDDLEYIVVDPGSTDGSRDIIDRYRNKISKILYEADNGPPDGLNKGFAKATGDIYGFLNSDDVLNPGALSMVARYFNDHPDVDVVYGHSQIIDAQGRHKRNFYSDHFSLWMAAYGAAILSQASTFFRADAFRYSGGFNAKNLVAWDGELWVDMAKSGSRFSRVDEFWSKFRVHEDGITGSGKLHEAYRSYNRFIFKKIMGREVNWVDEVIMVFAKYVRKVINSADTIERISHGPIYKSAKE